MTWHLFYCDLSIQLELDNIFNSGNQGALHAPPGTFRSPEGLETLHRDEEAPDHHDRHLSDELLLGEHREPWAETGHRLSEIVVVHAADEVCDKALPHVLVHAGEEELKQVHHTRPETEDITRDVKSMVSLSHDQLSPLSWHLIPEK